MLKLEKLTQLVIARPHSGRGNPHSLDCFGRLMPPGNDAWGLKNLFGLAIRLFQTSLSFGIILSLYNKNPFYSRKFNSAC